MTPSKAIFLLSLSYIIGVAIEFFYKIPQAFVWGILFGSVSLVIISFFAHKKLALVGFCLLVALLGVLRMQIAQFEMTEDRVRKLNDRSDNIALVGQVVGEPDIRETSQKLRVQIKNTESVVLVTVPRYPEYRYLDVLHMTGKLETPQMIEDFNYQAYLAKDGIYSVMDYPRVELVSGGKNTTLQETSYAALLEFKNTLTKSINIIFSPPESFIVKGVILGGTTTMPEELRQRFSATGLTHLTAISGSNVVILSNILMAFLLALGLWRGQAFYGAVTFVWLYIIIAGFPASGVRAAIMASVFLLAQKFGRQHISARVIVLTAAIMLLQNPFSLVYDVGFQLSFLASLGIIYGKPLFDQLFEWIKYEKVRYLAGILSVTLAAQLFTLPLIAYYFKTVSLVAPFTNILVIPVIDIIMVFGFLAAVIGIWLPWLGFIISLPAWVLLKYFLGVMAVFYQPWAVLLLQHISVGMIIGYYLVLAGVMSFLRRWQLFRKAY